jgi:hypothetical protein
MQRQRPGEASFSSPALLYIESNIMRLFFYAWYFSVLKDSAPAHSIETWQRGHGQISIKCESELLHHNHFLRTCVISGKQPVEVYTASNSSAVFTHSIPSD